jgi:hypothetical protein
MSGLEEIPEDAAGFMIIGSKYDLSPQEAEVLQRYWARPNAAILIMLEPQNDTPKQLYRFLREQGLRPQNDRVMLRNRSNRSVFEINSIFAPSLNCTREFWNSSTGLEGESISLILDSDNAAMEQKRITPYPLLADWSNLIVQWIYGYDAGMVLPYRLADWAGAYAILLLIGAWFTAIGIFASSMTGSQIISGIITIGLLVLIFFMGLIPVVWGEFPAAGIFHYMSCSEHLDRFSAGLVDTRPVIFYLTMTVLTLAVTIRIIDHRRWKH